MVPKSRTLGPWVSCWPCNCRQQNVIMEKTEIPFSGISVFFFVFFVTKPLVLRFIGEGPPQEEHKVEKEWDNLTA